MAEYMRLRQICLVAPQLAPVIADISTIMGLDVCYRDGNVAKYGLENALLPVDTILLEVVAPFQPGPGTAAGRFIEKTGGRGGYMAIFACEDPDTPSEEMVMYFPHRWGYGRGATAARNPLKRATSASSEATELTRRDDVSTLQLRVEDTCETSVIESISCC